ncbi:soluble calcium-activated nucleotidase 1-like isoform X2 [Ornithodoros turicata]|uniref:soluble calcium-activated nucleotidase 1-like isoform X2 n=1 Tax=Ornithodoros turicata TaxID=34597 RepID=UPI003139FA9E
MSALLPLTSDKSNMQEWIRMPTTYRMGNSTLRCQAHFVIAVALLGLVSLLAIYALLPWGKYSVTNVHEHSHQHILEEYFPYNDTYPLTKPIIYGRKVRYKIGVIADLDTDSKSKEETDTWISYLKIGYLIIDRSSSQVEMEWEEEMRTLKGHFAMAGRGMELSELVVFNGKLYAMDDRTGVVYEIQKEKVVPWLMLVDGSGEATKGFKSEWATVRDGELYVGGLGKEWTDKEGNVINHDPQWIKVVTPGGRVQHRDWQDNYRKLCDWTNYGPPGYMIHEAVAWSHRFKQWFFLPRRASKQPYNDVDDEERGTNLLLRMDPGFHSVQLSTVGPLNRTHGFSSFKFVPLLMDSLIVALKSEEHRGRTATYITVFRVEDGNVLYPETKIGDHKFEGIEFI